MEERKILKECQISSFADEIAPDLDRQIEVLKQLGISWVDFTGFTALEKGEKQMKEGDGAKAFGDAYRALAQILVNI